MCIRDSSTTITDVSRPAPIIRAVYKVMNVRLPAQVRPIIVLLTMQERLLLLPVSYTHLAACQILEILLDEE